MPGAEPAEADVAQAGGFRHGPRCGRLSQWTSFRTLSAPRAAGLRHRPRKVVAAIGLTRSYRRIVGPDVAIARRRVAIRHTLAMLWQMVHRPSCH